MERRKEEINTRKNSPSHGAARPPDALSQDAEHGTFLDAPSSESSERDLATGIEYCRPMSGAGTSTGTESPLRLGLLLRTM